MNRAAICEKCGWRRLRGSMVYGAECGLRKRLRRGFWEWTASTFWRWVVAIPGRGRGRSAGPASGVLGAPGTAGRGGDGGRACTGLATGTGTCAILYDEVYVAEGGGTRSYTWCEEPASGSAGLVKMGRRKGPHRERRER